MKCVQHYLKGFRTSWGSLESQGPRENQVILHQLGRTWELLARRVIGETPASKASKERRGNLACPVVQHWRPMGFLQGLKKQ